MSGGAPGMTPFVRFAPDGEVTEWGSTTLAAVEHEIDLGWPVAIGGGTEDWWVDVETRAVNPKTECAAYLDGFVVRDCPIPCKVIIGRDAYVCSDGEAELEFTQPGTYSVTIRSVRHLPKTFTVIVP